MKKDTVVMWIGDWDNENEGYIKYRDTNGNDISVKYLFWACLVEDTEVIVEEEDEKGKKRRRKKKIQDITYDDNIVVWDFDNGCITTAKPLWIMNPQVSDEYNYVKFEDGTELNTVGHRLFNVDSQKFTYVDNEEDTPIGTRVYKEDGTITRLTERKVIKERVNYYNIITEYHMNMFANGLLTSVRLNNIYDIEDMKFVKDDRELATREEFEGITDEFFYGLRLAEQPKEINRGNDDRRHARTLKEYVQRLYRMMKQK